jgi:DNA-binding SARP family transcriptional activator/tetratricopeptide (TPR) repeat protein
MRLDFRVLGAVDARADGRPLPLPGRMQPSVLAMLLLHANQVVAEQQLISAVWGPAAPTSVRAQLHSSVHGLRRALRARDVVVRQSGGYLIRVASDGLDLAVVGGKLAAARRARTGGDPSGAARLLRSALELWDDPPLVGVTDELADRERPGLVERRLAAVVDLMDAELAAGHHLEVLGELRAHVSRNPLHEALCARWMVALARSGRASDALGAYRELRRRLVEDLGVEPGAELRRVHTAVLRDEVGAGPATPPAVSAGPLVPTAGGPRPPGRTPPVCLLPVDVADFTGRREEIDRVVARLRSGEPGPIMITGRAGAGKTALAVRIAYRCRDDYPDGQLYLDLGGATRTPLRPAHALGRLLRALGVDPTDAPDDVDERAELFRSLVATRRLLLVLDNAHGAAQLRHLLPGGDTAAVLVTSRVRICGLPGGQQVELGALPPQPAHRLLAAVAGADRLRGEDTASRELVELCEGLPLALRIVGARLAARPYRPVGVLRDRLADTRRRLDELTYADVGVRSSLAVSHDVLGPTARRAFRLLSLVEGAGVPVWFAAALLDTSLDAAEAALDELYDARLVEAVAPDATGGVRYYQHDLIRLYAAERAHADEPEADRRAALERALGACLALAEQAERHYPQASVTPLHGPAPRWRTEHADRVIADPLAWFDAERALLLAALKLAYEGRFDDAAWDLAGTLTNAFLLRRHLDDWAFAADLAQASAERAARPRGVAVAHRMRSALCTLLPDYPRMLTECAAAETALRDSGDLDGLADLLTSRGTAYRYLSRHDEALSCFDEALRLARHDANARAELDVLFGRSVVNRERSRFTDALADLDAALPIARRLGVHHEEAHVLRYRAIQNRELGHLDRASGDLEAALAVFGSIGDAAGQADILEVLGSIHTRRGEHDRAHAAYQGALDILARCPDPFAEAAVRRGLGQLLLEQARGGAPAADAVVQLDRAAALYRGIKAAFPLGLTLVHLGDARAAAGDRRGARLSWQEALEIMASRNTDLAEDLRARLRSSPPADAEPG